MAWRNGVLTYTAKKNLKLCVIYESNNVEQTFELNPDDELIVRAKATIKSVKG